MPVTPIPKNSQLSSATINAPIQDLATQIDRVSDIVNTSAMSQSWYARSVPLQPGLLVGMAVYWNHATSRYEPAIAAASVSTYGNLSLSESSDCVGLLTAVFAGNTGDVLIDGIADIDLTAAVSGTLTPGRYYLSSSTPGMLVSTQPPVAVFVCRVLGKLTACHTAAQVLVRPQVRDVLLDHTHYRFSLACFPAGQTTPPAFGQKHTITSADSTKMGWLPATNPIFGGNAPTNAVFGYNLAADPNLAGVWPPIPVFSVAVLMDRGIGQGAVELPQGANGVVICDTHGIWWMSNCYGDAPWPVRLNTTVIPGSSYPHATSFDECPRIDHMRIELAYLRMIYANSNFVVTSLSAAANSPIKLTGHDSPNGKTGDVGIAFDPTVATSTLDALGGVVIKDISSTFGLSKGWLVEGITTSSGAITLVGSHTRHLDPSDSTSPLVSQGIVSLDIDLNPADRELTPPLIRLDGTVERLYKDVPYIGFPANRATSIRMSFNIPVAGVPAAGKFRLRLMLLGRASGTLTAMTATYRKIATLAAGIVEALPTTDTAFTIVTATAVTTDQLAGALSNPIDVLPGDTLFITLTRPSDVSFNGEIGLTRISGVVSTV